MNLTWRLKIIPENISKQIDRYFIDRKKVIIDLFVIEIRVIYVHTRDC